MSFIDFTVTVSLLAHFGEAFAAIYRTVGLGFERNTSLAAASSTGSGEELTRTACSILRASRQGLAALRLVLETALCVKTPARQR